MVSTPRVPRGVGRAGDEDRFVVTVRAARVRTSHLRLLAAKVAKQRLRP